MARPVRNLCPLEKTLGPAYRSLLRARGSQIGIAHPSAGNTDVEGVASETALRAFPLPASTGDVERLLRLYAGEPPEAVVRAICFRPSSLDSSGPSVPEQLGVVSGMVFVGITRALYGAPLQRFQSLDWKCVSRILRGLNPAPPSTDVLNEQAPPGPCGCG